MDSAISFLQDIKRLSPEFSPELKTAYNELVGVLRAGDFQRAKLRLARFHSVLELTGTYIAAQNPLNGPQLPAGYAEFASSPNSSEDVTNTRGFASGKGFADATKTVGLDLGSAAATRSVVAVADYTAGGDMFL